MSRKDAQAVGRVSSLTFPLKGPKYLVLQEVVSDLFFIGRYTEWERKVKEAGADPGDDDKVETMAAAEVATMVAAQSQSGALKKLTTRVKLEGASHTVSQFGPPSVEVAAKRRMSVERKEKAKKDKEMQQQKKDNNKADSAGKKGGARAGHK